MLRCPCRDQEDRAVLFPNPPEEWVRQYNPDMCSFERRAEMHSKAAEQLFVVCIGIVQPHLRVFDELAGECQRARLRTFCICAKDVNAAVEQLL